MAFKINDQLLTFIEEIRSEKSPEKEMPIEKEKTYPLTRQKASRDLPSQVKKEHEERVRTAYLMAKECSETQDQTKP